MDTTTWRLYQKEKRGQAPAYIAEGTLERGRLPPGWPSGGDLILRTKPTGGGGVSPRMVKVAVARDGTNSLPLVFDDKERQHKVVQLWKNLNYEGNAKAGEIICEEGCDRAHVYLVAEPSEPGNFRVHFRDGTPISRDALMARQAPSSSGRQRNGSSREEASEPDGTGMLPMQGRLRIDVGFLRREAYHRHEWIFGAFAELIHNSSDADATKVAIKTVPLGSKTLLEITDNGLGMSKEDIDFMMQLGRQQDVDDTHRSGRFGYGFKTGSMRIAHHAVVLTRSKHHKTLCVGFLSRKTSSGSPDIKCETLKARIESEGLAMAENMEEWDALMRTIQERTGVINQLFIGNWLGRHKGHGTTIFLCDLVEKEDSNGKMRPELDLTTAADDIRIWQEDLEGHRKVYQRKSKDGVLAEDIEMDYSLRAYIAIMYRTLRTRPPSADHPEGIDLRVVLRGKVVERKSLEDMLTEVRTRSVTVQQLKEGRMDAEKLFNLQQASPSPAAHEQPTQSDPDGIRVSVGFSSSFKQKKLGGVMLYSANCLISSFLREAANITAPEQGLGVVLMVELPKKHFEPLDNKQGFHDNHLYRRLLLFAYKAFQAYDSWLEKRHYKTMSRSEAQGSEIKGWIQCDACNKWRKLPNDYCQKHASKKWYCFQDDSPLLKRSHRPCRDLPEDVQEDSERVVVDDAAAASAGGGDTSADGEMARKRPKLSMKLGGKPVGKSTLAQVVESLPRVSFTIDESEEMERGAFGCIFAGKWDRGEGRKPLSVLIEKPSSPQLSTRRAMYALRDLNRLSHTRCDNVPRYYFADRETGCVAFSPAVKQYRPFREALASPSVRGLPLYTALLDIGSALEWCLEKKMRLPCLWHEHVRLQSDGSKVIGMLVGFDASRRLSGAPRDRDEERLLYTPREHHRDLDGATPEALSYGLALLVYEVLLGDTILNHSPNFRLPALRRLASDTFASELLKLTPPMMSWSVSLENATWVNSEQRLELGDLVQELQKLRQQLRLNEQCPGDMYHLCLYTTELKHKAKKMPPHRAAPDGGSGSIADFAATLPEGTPKGKFLSFLFSFEAVLFAFFKLRPHTSGVVVTLPGPEALRTSLKRELVFVGTDSRLQQLSDQEARALREVCHLAVKTTNMPVRKALSLTGRTPLLSRLLSSCEPTPGMEFAQWKREVLTQHFSDSDLMDLEKELEVDCKRAMRLHSARREEHAKQEEEEEEEEAADEQR